MEITEARLSDSEAYLSKWLMGTPSLGTSTAGAQTASTSRYLLTAACFSNLSRTWWPVFFLFGFSLIKHGRDLSDLCHEQGIRPSDVRHRGLTLYRQAPGSRRVSLSPSGRVYVYIHVQHQQLYH